MRKRIQRISSFEAPARRAYVRYRLLTPPLHPQPPASHRPSSIPVPIFHAQARHTYSPSALAFGRTLTREQRTANNDHRCSATRASEDPSRSEGQKKLNMCSRSLAPSQVPELSVVILRQMNRVFEFGPFGEGVREYLRRYCKVWACVLDVGVPRLRHLSDIKHARKGGRDERGKLQK